QDRKNILWGENWQDRIGRELAAVTFLIPIFSPSFLRSPACRGEVERFLARERSLARRDLILPVYYINCAELNEAGRTQTDTILLEITNRQYVDWRELRGKSFRSSAVRVAINRIALQIV